MGNPKIAGSECVAFTGETRGSKRPAVDEQAVGKPGELWVRFAEVASIDRDGFLDYYHGAGQAVGIVIGRVNRYDQPPPDGRSRR